MTIIQKNDVRANQQNQDINPVQLPPDNQVNPRDRVRRPPVWLWNEEWDLKWIINVLDEHFKFNDVLFFHNLQSDRHW